MENKTEKKGTTLGDIKEWFRAHKSDDMYKALEDFADDVGRLFEAMCVLYEENKVPMSMLGVRVSLKVESTGLYGPDGSVIAPGLGLIVRSELGARAARDDDNGDNGEETDVDVREVKE